MQYVLFFISVIFILFLPGYFLLLAVCGKGKALNSLEKFLFSFGLSITSVDFIFFLYAKLGWSITRLSAIAGVAVFTLVCVIIYELRKRNWIPDPAKGGQASPDDGDEKNDLFNFSKRQFVLIALFVFLMFFLKAVFISGSILPSSTDMGHHMYWTKWMVENHQLPTYEGMPDYIIGEHIIFGLISMLSGLDIFSAFPVAVLNLINIVGILAVFVLVLRIFKDKNVAIFSLFFLGVLFAVSSPQSKYAATGVVGNILGNFFVPAVFYFYFRAIESLFSAGINNETKKFLALAIFLNFGLFYTHHLTSFIFLFVFFLTLIAYLISNWRESKNIAKSFLKLFFSPKVISVFILGLFFFFFIFTPNYANPKAVDTAVGAPEKITRVGLSLENIQSTVGGARFALGFLGLIFLILSYRKNNFGHALLACWAVMIFIMSFKPQWLFIDLPSARIGNYLSYPLAILSAYGFCYVFLNNKNSSFLFKSAFGLVLVFALMGGIGDSVNAFKTPDKANELAQTFHSSQYLAGKVDESDMVLKDHNYIVGDVWMKSFFMRGYRYPLSRSYFRRYEDQINPREMCTLQMISTPGNSETQQCFAETGTNFFMVNPQYDTAQFFKLDNFDKIYANKDVVIFYRK